MHKKTLKNKKHKKPVF